MGSLLEFAAPAPVDPSLECGTPPETMASDVARSVLGVHADHGPDCRAKIAALAELSTVLG
jgi:hypothetical protein